MVANNQRVYFDHNATTPVGPWILEKIPDLALAFGNASSIHHESRVPRQVLRETRLLAAKILNVNPLEVIFTSGGSESNTTVIRGLFDLYQEGELSGTQWAGRSEFISTTVEHPSVLRSLEKIQKLGAQVHFINVSKDGEVDLNELENVLSSKTLLVSMMIANNETGTLFPIKQVTQLVHAKGALMHSDCVQGIGKLEIDLQDLGIDYASFSAHKFYSLKGSGLLYQRRGVPLEPLIFGGKQERQRRSGTENILSIGAMGLAFEKMDFIFNAAKEIAKLRDYLEESVLNSIDNVKISCAKAPRLPNTSHMVIFGVDGESLLMNLDLEGFAVSTGAACSSGNPEPSPVLLKMGFSRTEAQASLRVSLGLSNTKDQVDRFVTQLKIIVGRVRDLNKEMETGNKD